MRIHLVIAAAALIVAGCGSSASSPSGQPGPASAAAPTASVPASSGPTPGISVAMASPGANVGMAVEVLNDLALLKTPDPGSDGAGTLPAGTNAWISGAAVDGGKWYQLVPLGPGNDLTAGWVGATEGDAVLAPIELGCDSIGVSASLLAGLSSGSKLACYSEPFTFAARIVNCNCDIDGGYVDPEWLGNSSVNGPDGPTTALLVDENQTTAPPNVEDWLLLHLAPDAVAPDTLPFDQVVEITGQFDHPAASTCVVPEGVEIAPDDPVLFCRTNLAITAIN